MHNSATPTRLLSVNAAFLKEIKEDNQQLKALWDRVVPIAQQSETALNHWTELVGLFAQLRDQLALHFSLEEAYGYFDDAIDTAPQLSVAAGVLRSEHSSLFALIRDLADHAADAHVDRVETVTPFVDQFADFKKRFETHEEAELKLILDAMDEDLGVGD